MPAKKKGCVGSILAVVFTTVVAPVLVSTLTRETTHWPEWVSALLEEKQPAAWSDVTRPAVEDFVRPHPAATLERPVPVQPSACRGPAERANGIWRW